MNEKKDFFFNFSIFQFFPNFFFELGAERCSEMEEQEDGWLTVLEKNGLGPEAAILENYGIDSETDLLVLDQDDFRKLASRGLKPLYAKMDTQYSFTLEPYVNGTPAPSLVTKEVDMTVTGPFLLVNRDYPPIVLNLDLTAVRSKFSTIGGFTWITQNQLSS